MSWQAIARKDVRDSVRSRGLWVLLALFLLLLGLFAYAAWIDTGADVFPFIDITTAGFGLLVPLVAVVLGYKAVVTERESGTLALALSLPQTRREFVLGKFLGRSLVLALPVLVAMLATLGIVLVLYEDVPLMSYLVYVGLNVLYGLAFLAIAIGLSMSTTSGRRVTAGAFGAYVLLVMLWADLVELLLILLWRFDATVLVDKPDWALFVQLLSPFESYQRLVATLFEAEFAPAYTAPDAPWLVDSWVALLVLVGWVGGALGLGYLRFRRADL